MLFGLPREGPMGGNEQLSYVESGILFWNGHHAAKMHFLAVVQPFAGQVIGLSEVIYDYLVMWFGGLNMPVECGALACP